MKIKQKRFWLINFHIFIDVIAVVLVWRGVWVLVDMYLFPDKLLLSSVLGIVIGILILMKDDNLLKELGSHNN